jgi:glycosyltransferase involved in cell wall biosynthesis
MTEPFDANDPAPSEKLQRAREEIERLEQMIELLRARQADTESSLQSQLEMVRAQLQDERARLRSVYESETWRLGHTVASMARALRHPRRLARRGAGRGTRSRAATTPPPIALPTHRLSEDRAIEELYVRAVTKRRFGRGGVRLAMAVQTLDFREGRGDIYTAVGLGRYLERIGYDVVYLPRERWYHPPDRVEIYLALLDEVDLFQVKERCLRIGWIRNRTNAWIESGSLQLYDALLASSERSVNEIKRTYTGPVGLLRIGVDGELFAQSANDERAGVVTTVNQWGRERQVYQALAQSRRDFPLAIYGEQRGLNPDLLAHWNGKTSYFALPSLYSQASIVLDDHNHTAQPFGNVNSRVYEALASGALVISNASLGLHEAGLAEVPVYETPAQLDDLIHRFLAAPAEMQELTERLRSEIVAHHTFEDRAAEFDRFHHDIVAGGHETNRRIVGFFPDYRHTNPYQTMLYSWGQETPIAAIPVQRAEDVSGSVLADDRFVYHLHWTAPILGGATSAQHARKKMAAFLGGVDELHAQGAAFIWTIHNVMPHECAFPEVEAELRRQLADRADIIHVMCAQTGDMVSPYFKLPPDRVHVVPHPNYIDVYPNVIDETRARRELGLRPDDTVLCHFGGIRPYKGLDDLLDAFERASEVDDRLRLILAGAAGRFEGLHELRERCRSNPRIIANFNRIGEGDVQAYVKASDCLVLSHRSVLNSGSLMLALSFGRPVIAPAVGCLEELLSEDLSIAYGSRDELYDAILRARDLKAPSFRQAAYRKAEQYPVSDLAERFAQLIMETAAQG